MSDISNEIEHHDVHDDDVHEVLDEEAGLPDVPARRPLEVDDGDWAESNPDLALSPDDDHR